MEVYDFSNDNLLRNLTNENCNDEINYKRQIDYIFNYLTELDCKKIVIERGYIDRDYLEDYSQYYSKCFKKYDSRCKRIHFFKKFDEKKFSDYLNNNKDENYLKELNTHYLGFLVAKPLPRAVIGRTCLHIPKNTIYTKDDKDLTNTKIIRCVRPYTANLYGIDLKIESLAFQEQDMVISACATSALWSALQKSTDFFKVKQPNSYEITKKATQYISTTRSIPSKGLSLEQISQAIKENELEPEIYQYYYKDAERNIIVLAPLLNICYSYLKAGLPIVLGIDIKDEGYHAITLIGYELSDNMIMDEFSRLSQPISILKTKASYISKFYIHDDQVGPFSKLDIIWNSATNMINFRTEWVDNQQNFLEAVPETIFIPVYHKIRVPISPIFEIIAEWTNWLNETELLGLYKDYIIWDCYLCNINEYKKEILKKNNILDKVDTLISRFPRFFWRIIGYFRNQELIEFLADATDMEPSFQIFKINYFLQTQNFKNEIKEIIDDPNRLLFNKAYLSNSLFEILHKSVQI